MKKRFFSIMLVLCMAVSVIVTVPVSVAAEDSGTCGDNLTWTLDDIGTLTISGTGDMYDEPSWTFLKSDVYEVIIEDGVTSIGNDAFRNCQQLREVNIPNSVTSIGDMAFSDCKWLCEVIIPDNVTTIGERAFAGCEQLHTVYIPDSVTSIGNGVFSYCTRLTDIPVGSNNQNYSNVGGSLFNKDETELIQYATGKNDEEYIIPDGVTSIRNYAFAGSDSLTTITIPDSVTNIGDWVFDFCFSLTNITVNSNNPNFSTVDGNLFNKDKTELIQYALGKSNEEYIIPNGVTSIGKRAFLGCNNITSVTIPNSVTDIEERAFADCESLSTVVISDSVTTIGDRAFNSYGITDVYYTGTEEQWNGISFGYKNEALTTAKIHYNYVPNEIVYNAESNVIELISSDAISGKVIVATYNDHRLINANIYDAEQTINNVTIDKTNATTAKIFWWDSLNGLVPKCTELEISL